MIQFFRRIRQNLLTENKFKKYLLYAIGEIVLVVIGILIALGINNWNQERKNISLKKSYLENLKVDLKKDIENLRQLDSINTTAETEGLYLAAFLDNNLVEVDTLRLTNSIFFCGYIPNSTIISATYNDLINSNNIILFNDVVLKRYLDDYYIQDNWVELFNNRILKTAWYDYRDEMSKFHSPLLYQDYYKSDNSIELNYSSKYHVEWNNIKNNKYLITQVGMIGAYRIIIRNNLENHIQKAKTILNYIEKSK
ncbi:MAG: hypothetical protein HKP24_10585 [Croceitalea sp.]|nr:hypothetical protein [Croceitalea sp.]MBT8239026.1 hypothetical protein [Croceitalea sp.]NNC34626.1 hypothetical protein [Croceitalea sp.]NNM18999.1 hypothetical protein [Croceitalea sp.]